MDTIYIDIDMTILENVDINIDIDRDILETIDSEKDILLSKNQFFQQKGKFVFTMKY